MKRWRRMHPWFSVLFGYVYSFAYIGWKKRREGLLFIGILPSAAFTVAYLTSEFQSKGLWFLAAGVTMLLHQDSCKSNHYHSKLESHDIEIEKCSSLVAQVVSARSMPSSADAWS